MDGLDRPEIFLRPATKAKTDVKTQKGSDWKSIEECISVRGISYHQPSFSRGRTYSNSGFRTIKKGRKN